MHDVASWLAGRISLLSLIHPHPIFLLRSRSIPIVYRLVLPLLVRFRSPDGSCYLLHYGLFQSTFEEYILARYCRT